MLEKVIIFIPAIERGGVERNAIWVANELAGRGYRTDVVFVRSEEGQLEKLVPEVHQVKFDLKRVPFLNERLSDAWSIRKCFKQYLKEQNPMNTVVIAFQSASAAIGICHKQHIKVVCRLSNHPSAVKYEKSTMRKLSEWLKPHTYKKADQVIGNSRRLSEDFGRTIQKEVLTIYNPIDFEQIETARVEKIEKELVEEAEKYQGKLFITVGRLTRQKDIATMLHGFAESNAANSGMLWIIGEGNEEEELKELADTLQIREHVHFLGYQTNVYKYLNYADVFVQTSLYEGCPNALIEAVAAGLPAIATDCLSGPTEVLLDGLGGDLIAVGDAGALAQCINRFLEHPEVLRKKQEAAAGQMERFRNEKVMQQYLTMMEELCSQK